jgi:hypothetical protein
VSPDRTTDITEGLSDLGRRVLKAAVLCGISTETACTGDLISTQLCLEDQRRVRDALRYLAQHDPPIMARAPGQGYTLTYQGSLVAKMVFAETVPRATDVTVPPERVRSQAQLDREMDEYAASVGASVWHGDGGRCSMCGHSNSYGLQKGGKRLCQVCYKVRGRRF